MIQDREELREFLLRACHDLRAPLRAVRAHAELLLKAPEVQGRLEFTQIAGFVANGATDANALVDALSNYALALQIQANPIQVSTAVLLRGVLAKLAAEVRDCGAEITCDDLPQVSGDPDRLMQLLENLISNAIQHRSEQPPRVHVSARKQNTEWIFAVRDNGPGIASEDLERIFQPFERLNHNGKGAGLGLAACRAIVAGHGGRIWAESIAGAGTTFYFTLASSD